ncbi:MAG: aspartyl-tRNA(Asn)/glutamyl-tRNA (Gln) amidotransferase subunit [Planctomycetota bacterium]|nr:MAG: aspartyl-tRNA(Asn)/glutamyl-tRNA (Gln) amidotransferase subunit [Planctomycetota bacterium]
MIDLTASEIRDGVRAGKWKAREVVDAHLERIAAVDPKLHAYLHVDADGARAAADRVDASGVKGLLAGVPVAVKDNMCQRGIPTTCASKILEGFRPPYDATALLRALAAGAVPVGHTNLDEFAMGSSTENSAYGPSRNPWDPTRAPGGSSGGSAVSVAARMTPLAFGSDTGGSIRQPAALCGVVGMKPTYGRVSRYGLVAFASSLDQIGPIARTVRDAAMFLQAFAGHDALDSTSAPAEVPDYEKDLEAGVKGLRVGVPKEFFGAGTDPGVRAAIDAALKVLQKQGATLVEMSLPHTDYGIAAYYVIAPCEASSNLARYDGVRFGHRAKSFDGLIDMYRKSRTEGFGEEVRRRILLGTFALSSGYYEAYYKKALQVRRLIKNDFDEAWKKVDVIAGPTSPIPAFKIGEKANDPIAMYLCDVLTVTAPLAGIPGISVPAGFTEGNLPVGLQLLGKEWSEATLLRTARSYERETEFWKRSPAL